MSTDMNAEITRLASVMNDLKSHEDSLRKYHMMSGAFVWDDEMPSVVIGEDVALRYLLRFRTSLLIGSPIESLRPNWEFAKIMWPNWPGFSAERCEYSETLKCEYDEIQSKEEDFLSSFNQ